MDVNVRAFLEFGRDELSALCCQFVVCSFPSTFENPQGLKTRQLRWPFAGDESPAYRFTSMLQ
jgi:hypothetical protein